MRIQLIVFLCLSQLLIASQKNTSIDEAVLLENVQKNEDTRISFVDRVRFLKTELAQFKKTSDVNIPFCAHLIRSFNQNKRKILSAIFLGMKHNKHIDVISGSILYDAIFNLKFEAVDDRTLTQLIQKSDKNKMCKNAYHKAGHAHVLAHCSKSRVVGRVSILIRKKLDEKKSHELNYHYEPSFLHDISVHESIDPYLDFEAEMDALISASFAGGIAEQLFTAKEDESNGYFPMVTYFLNLIGLNGYNRDYDDYLLMQSTKNDLKLIYNLSEIYVRHLLKQAGCLLSKKEIKEEIDKIMYLNYQRTYAFVAAHQEEIEKTATLLQTNYKMYGDTIYEHAGIDRPKFFFERDNYLQRSSLDEESAEDDGFEIIDASDYMCEIPHK